MKRTSNVVHDASGRNGHTARSHASVAWRIAVALMLCLPAGTVPISTASANDAPPKETAPTVAADAPAGSSDSGAPPPSTFLNPIP